MHIKRNGTVSRNHRSVTREQPKQAEPATRVHEEEQREMKQKYLAVQKKITDNKRERKRRMVAHVIAQQQLSMCCDI